MDAVIQGGTKLSEPLLSRVSDNRRCPVLIRETKCVTLLVVRHCQAAGDTQPIHNVKYIIHQEAMCSKPANLVDVTSVGVKAANLLLSYAYSFKHRQHQALTDEVIVHNGHLLYFCEFRWLNRGAMLSRVGHLQQAIAILFRQKN